MLVPAAKFTHDGILDAAADEVLHHDYGVTLGGVASRLGAPIGSLYHRFASREELLTRLWLRSVQRFHGAYLEAGNHDDPQLALLAMARCVAIFTRDHQAEAAAMTLFRQSRLVKTAPVSCRAEVRAVNEGTHQRLQELARARYTHPTARHQALVRVAAIDNPYGLVRTYVWTHVPDWLPEVIEASSAAVLALGDAPRIVDSSGSLESR